MSREELRSIYSKRIDQFREAVSRQSKLISYISLARLLVLVTLHNRHNIKRELMRKL